MLRYEHCSSGGVSRLFIGLAISMHGSRQIFRGCGKAIYKRARQTLPPSIEVIATMFAFAAVQCKLGCIHYLANSNIQLGICSWPLLSLSSESSALLMKFYHVAPFPGGFAAIFIDIVDGWNLWDQHMASSMRMISLSIQTPFCTWGGIYAEASRK
jgi:hypothetical protein